MNKKRTKIISGAISGALYEASYNALFASILFVLLSQREVSHAKQMQTKNS